MYGSDIEDLDLVTPAPRRYSRPADPSWTAGEPVAARTRRNNVRRAINPPGPIQMADARAAPQSFRLHRRTRLPRRVNRDIYTLARYEQALYNKRKRQAAASEISGLAADARAEMAMDGMGSYHHRRRRRYARRPRVRGRGGFFEDLAGWGKGLVNRGIDYAGRVTGRAGLRVPGVDLKPYLKAGAGTLIDTGAGMAKNWLLGKIGGQGAYHDNALIQSCGMGVPQFSGSGMTEDGLTVCHEEYLGDIYVQSINGSTAAYQVCYSVPLNPALVTSFPWLSQVAANYDEYEFEGMIFTFKTTMADVNTSNTSIGTVMMVTNYNAANVGTPVNGVNTPFYNKQQLLDYDASQSGKISESQHHGVECDPTKNGMSAILYTRSGPVPVGQDKKTYDLGIFQLFAQGINLTAPGQIGELYVSYKVNLRKPKIYAALGYTIPQDVFTQNATSGSNSVLSTAMTTAKSVATISSISSWALSTETLVFVVGSGATIVAGQKVFALYKPWAGTGVVSAVSGTNVIVKGLYGSLLGGQWGASDIIWTYDDLNTYNNPPVALPTSSVGGTLATAVGYSPQHSDDIIHNYWVYTFPIEVSAGSFRFTLNGVSSGSQNTTSFVPCNSSSIVIQGGNLVADINSSSSFESNGSVTYTLIFDVGVTSPGVSQCVVYFPGFTFNGSASVYVDNVYFDVSAYNPLSTA